MPNGPDGQRVDERGARLPPLLDQCRNGVGQQLVVHAVEDDRERGAEDEQLLVPGPAPFVEHCTDINRFHPDPLSRARPPPGRLPQYISHAHMML